VVIVKTIDEVTIILCAANQYKIPLTFRAAGTSLSGQAVTANVLVMLANDSWCNYQVLANGKQIKLAPGIIASHANAILKPYSTKLGPDPASINACKIGGIVANNSSGMCCGVAQNTYYTMASIKVMLANGFMLDSADEGCYAQLSVQFPQVVAGINEIYQQITSSPRLVDKIRHKFSIKNTSGYSLNAFLDFINPVDIIAHLIVGSEGTLGFIREITYNTVVDYQHKSVSLIYLATTKEVVELSMQLNHSSVKAIELLDESSLRAIASHSSASHCEPCKKHGVAISHHSSAECNSHISHCEPCKKHGVAISHHSSTDCHSREGVNPPDYLPPTLAKGISAILVEVATNAQDELVTVVDELQQIINQHEVVHQIHFTSKQDVIDELWQIRKGIFPLIGANRQTETSVIIEDIAVAINELPELVSDLTELFAKYNYANHAIFGHVLAGNIHFVFTPNLTISEEVTNYDNFMREITKLVVNKYAGSLKAEHGCGRNMAPFIEFEWGEQLYAIMHKVKNLLDPNNILNPDVILTQDKQLHLKHLKSMPAVEGEADKCIECGFCEQVCPSKNLSLTPRQRIASYRYLKQLRSLNYRLWRKLWRQYQYLGVKTCATTGMCQSSCPVAIDTGKLMLSLDNRENSWWLNLISRNYARFIYINRLSIQGLARLNNFANVITKITLGLRKLSGRFPLYLSPAKFAGLKSAVMDNPQNSQNDEYLYLASCSSRVLEKYSSFSELCNVLGIRLTSLEQANNNCCGQFFDSRNANNLGQQKRDELSRQIDFKRYKYVIIDNSSCYYTLKNNVSTANLTSELDFLWQYFNNSGQKLNRVFNKIVLHIDCTSQKLGVTSKVMDILNRCAQEVIILDEISCCGFAGTKGYTVPELNKSALSGIRGRVETCDCGVTLNPNCAVGLTYHSKIPYYTLSQLLLRCV
jgi:D-lactate dehydrogenase